MRYKFGFIVVLLTICMLVSCGGGGGGGRKGGSGTDGGSYQTVRLGFDIHSNDGNISSRTISATGSNPLPDAKYYYKATPKWNSQGGNITGATTGFVEFDPDTFRDNFALGKWTFEIQVRTNSTNNVVLYDTALVNNEVPVVVVDANTNMITVTLDKKQNGYGTVNIDIFAPTVSANDKVTIRYGKIGGTEISKDIAGTPATSEGYSNYSEFKETITDVPAGLYIFHAVYSYTYVDAANASNTVTIENENMVYCEVFGDGSVDITGTIEGNQNVLASFSINGIKVMGVTVKAVKSVPPNADDTEVTDTAVTAGTNLYFKATPMTGTAGSNWITYETPDTYQWYVNGDPVANSNSQYFTFSTQGMAPNTSYVYCLISKKNAANVVEYAAGAGKVVIVKP